MSSDNSDSVPESVGKVIDSDQVIADIGLGGGDAIFVTPAQTIRYQSKGLLSDELTETYQHDVERIAVSKKRRKANLTLIYDGAETAEFSIPLDQTEKVLPSILTGVLHAMHAIESNETVHRVFRFSELTVVITETRLLKHVGEGVWSTEFESYHYDTVDDLTFEEGSHATTVVLAVADRTERFKTPQQQANAVRDTLASALTAHWGVESITQYRTDDQMIATTQEKNNTESTTSSSQSKIDLSVDGIDPLGATTNSGTTTETVMSTDIDGIDSESTVDESIMTSDLDSSPDENSDRDSTAISSQSHPIRDEDETVSQSQRDSQASQLQREHINKISDIHAEIRQLNQLIEAQQQTLEMHGEILNQLVEDLHRYTDEDS